MSAPWSLPGAADRLAQALGDLNAFVTPRALRRYQLDILRYGALRVPSPWTGEPLRSSGCHVSNLSVAGFGNIVIAYRFRCEQTFWLIAGMATQGESPREFRRLFGLSQATMADSVSLR